MSSLIKNVSTTFGAKIFSTILALGSSIFLTRLLGKEGNGIYGFILANVNLFVVLFGFGMSRTMTYFIAKNESDSSKVSGFGIYLSVIGLIVFSLISFLLYYYDSSLSRLVFPKGYVSLFVVVFMIGNFAHKTAIEYFTGIWQGKLRFKYINFTLLISNAIRIFVLGCLWFYAYYFKTEVSIVHIFGTILIIITLDLLIRLVVFYKGKYKINFNILSNNTLNRSIIVFGSMGIATRILNFANKRLDIWFVEGYNGLEELGVYLLAVGLVDIMIATIVPGVQVLIPYYTQRNPKQRMQLLSKVSRINLVFTFLLICLVILMSSFLIPLLYGKEFEASVFPFMLLAIGAFFLLIRNVFSAFNVAINQQHINIKANIIALILTLTLDIILIPNYGIVGACYASIIAYSVSCFFVLFITIYGTNVSISNFIFIKRSDFALIYDYAQKKLFSKFK